MAVIDAAAEETRQKMSWRRFFNEEQLRFIQVARDEVDKGKGSSCNIMMSKMADLLDGDVDACD